MDSSFTLLDLGWQPYFQQQLSLDDLESNRIARICSRTNHTYELISESGTVHLLAQFDMPDMTIGDWVIINTEGTFLRRLDRTSTFDDSAANIDTVFILCALDQNFNLPLIKHYLKLVHEAQADAVVILTKADLCEDAQEKRAQVERLDPLLIVETVSTLETDSIQCLNPWFKKGKTVAVLGPQSSGKSSLITTLKQTAGLLGTKLSDTNTLQRLPTGAILLDTQALHDLTATQYNDIKIESYADILSLEKQCRFSDCRHQEEPGCAIKNAVTHGNIDLQRAEDFLLLRSDEQNNEGKVKSKPQEKFHRSAQSDVRARKHSAID